MISSRLRLPQLAALSSVALLAGLGSVAAAQSLQNMVLQNSFALSGAGARASGMGGAFIAVADDGTASSFNPAGLAQLSRSELAAVVFGRQSNTVIDVGGGDVEIDEKARSRWEGIEFVGLAVPFELGTRRLTVQASYQRVVDFLGEGHASVRVPLDTAALQLPPDTQYQIALDSDQSGALHTTSLAAGLDVVGPLSIGASLNFWDGSWRARGTEKGGLHIPEGDPLTLMETRFDQDQRLSGMSLNLGVLLRGSWLRVGGVARLPFDGNYRLTETQTSSFSYPDEAEVGNYRMRSRLHWPRSLGVGVALRPFRRLTLAADYLHTEWSQTVLDNVPNGALLSNPVVDEQDNPVPDLYEDRNFFDLFPASQTLTVDSGQWRGGIEYLLTLPRVVIPLRVGCFYEKSPVPSLDMRDSRVFAGLTFGLGLNFDRLVLDMAWEARATEGPTGAVMTPDFRQSVSSYDPETVLHQRVVLSLIVRPGRSGSEDPLVKLLRKVFGG